jgi:hypothetical protein
VLVLVLAVVVGLAAGWVRPPLGARGLRLTIVRLPLLVAGALGTAISQAVGSDAGTLVLGLSLGVLAAFAASNTHVTGIAVMGLGLVLNLAAVVLNDGMPVRPAALVAAHVVDRAELPTVELAGPRHLETPRDRLPVLGDVLPLPLAREVLSFGDLMILVGTADAVRDLARRRRRRWSRVDRVDYESAMTQLRVVHDWGAAPRGAPTSGSQYSAKPEVEAPTTIDLTSDHPTPGARPLVQASHSR